jgi:hypothetical protein
MAQVNTATRITLKELVTSVATVGHLRTIIARGEPGIGKSWTLKALASKFPNHKVVCVDCARLLDQGDFWAMYLEDKADGGKRARQALLDIFDFDPDQPMLILLDEIGKMNKAVMNVILTIIFDRRIGDRVLHPDSIVYATTNLTADGVGDFLPAHARSRAVVVEIIKPIAGFNPDNSVEPDSFGAFMLANDFDPAVVAFVSRNPQTCESYRDCPNPKDWNNPYVFHPTLGAEAYVCGRSLHAVSDIVKARDVLGHRLSLSLIAGAAGESFARDFAAFLMIKDKLTSISAIVTDPKGAALPPSGDAVSHCVMVQQLVAHLKKDTVDAFVTYMQRMSGEWQAMFGRSVIAAENKQDIAIKCTAFRDWAITNQWMFS